MNEIVHGKLLDLLSIHSVSEPWSPALTQLKGEGGADRFGIYFLQEAAAGSNYPAVLTSFKSEQSTPYALSFMPYKGVLTDFVFSTAEEWLIALTVLASLLALDKIKGHVSLKTMATELQSRGPVAYHSGTVFTACGHGNRVEAFIVSAAGEFTAVGSNDDILDIARCENLPTFNLQSRFVMPGIHDAHVHILVAGLSRLSNVKPGFDATRSNIAERLKSSSCACEHARAYGDWIVGDLYHIENFDREALDHEFPRTPVLLRGGGGHAMFLNTAALERSGYSLAEPDMPHHQYFRRPDGTLTGEVAELAMTKAALALPKPEMTHVKRCILHAMKLLHSVGVTRFQEAASNTIILRALGELDAAGELKMDVQTHIVYEPEQLGEESFDTLHKTLDNAANFQSKHVQTNFAKLMLDGVPLHPYYTHAGLTESGDIDESKIQIDDLAEAVAKLDARGMTCKIHCTGYGSTRRALDVYEAVRKSNRHGPRHEIAHCSGVHDDDYPRFKQLNVTAEMSPSMFFVHPLTASSGGLMDWNWGKMIRNGAHMTVGSDWAFQDPSILPACALIMDSVAAALPAAEDATTTAAAAAAICRMLTVAGAVATGRENRAGTIEVGKKANFIMIDRDLSKGEFEGAQVLGTWFEGERVYEAPGESGNPATQHSA